MKNLRASDESFDLIDGAEPIGFWGCFLGIFISLIVGAGLMGLYFVARFALMLCGVKFNSM